MIETMDTRVKATVESVNKPFDGNEGIVIMSFDEGTPFKAGVKINKPFDLSKGDVVMVELSAYSSVLNITCIYKNESEYYESGFEEKVECFVPFDSSFRLLRDADSCEEMSQDACMNAKVRIAEEHYEDDAHYYVLLVDCLGVQFTVFVNPEELGNKLPEAGNIISGMFFIEGDIC